MGAFVRSAWAWPAIALLILAVSLAPFLVVDVPAVLDYPNHLARFYVLAHPDDPFLSKVYVAHWAILPNVGMDVIGQALLRVLPPSVGGRLLLAMSLLAPLAGVILYARAAFGRWTWWSLGAGAIAYNGIFILGFMNFLLGLGVALAGAGAWRVLRRRNRDVAAPCWPPRRGSRSRWAPPPRSMWSPTTPPSMATSCGGAGPASWCSGWCRS